MTIELEMDEHFTLEISEVTSHDYAMTVAISNWLKENLENLKDDHDKVIFTKVNTGFSENNLKTFGAKPTCDVYIDHVEYASELDNHHPESIHSILIFYIKGSNSTVNSNACALHDYIMQEFLENMSFKRLPNIVKNTYIAHSELRNQPINKKWGVMGVFELTHELYL